MKLKCKCGQVIGYGEITHNDKNKKVLVLKTMYPKLQGAVLRNKSRNPKKWTFICIKCQKDANKPN